MSNTKRLDYTKLKKTILLSVKKKYIDLILDGKKTLEVRKTFPHLKEVERILNNHFEKQEHINLLTYEAYLYECGIDGSHKVRCSVEINGFKRIDHTDIMAGRILDNIFKSEKHSYFTDETLKDFQRDMLDDKKSLSLYQFQGKNFFITKEAELLFYELISKMATSRVPSIRNALDAISFSKESCLSFKELELYLGDDNYLYGYNLENIKECNLPLEDFYLSENKKCVRPPQSFYYVLDKIKTR